MKSRFSTLDIRAVLAELQRFVGLRVNNIYDVDHKIYLIKLTKPDTKAVILIESGIRIHSTEFEWPKNPMPSGFSVKLRKHLKGRRLEVIEQIGLDRIIDLQFGSGEAAYHIILELYDRGNIILTDSEYIILNILRPRTDECQDVKFAVREKYPKDLAKSSGANPNITEILANCKEGDSLKKLLIPQLVYGPALIEHSLLECGLDPNQKTGKTFNGNIIALGKFLKDNSFRLSQTDTSALQDALQICDKLFKETCQPRKGYITQKFEKRMTGGDDQLITYNEFHPFKFKQHDNNSVIEFESFDKACDEFFSKSESQKLDIKALQQEKAALKKLSNVKKDHEKRIDNLQKTQEMDQRKAELIQINLELVEKAIMIVQSALANQIAWDEIGRLVKEAQKQNDAVALSIKQLNLDRNHITLLLSEPYLNEDDYEKNPSLKPQKVEIDLGLTAFANARKYYDERRQASLKEKKTIEASSKALKNAEKKTKETLKEASKIASINKARKVYWFEKFLWFISSENYLVIGGRDSQQNEMLVKRYMRSNDVYVHADLHGASSVIIKNHMGNEMPVPPKTLNEAGTMAICNSAAWDSKVVTSAWWVNPSQVSKSAPTGEYLSSGAFMIRGKKNYLPPSYLIYGFGFLFKLDDDCIERHNGERKVRVLEEEDEGDIEEQEEIELKEASKTDKDCNDDEKSEDDNEDSEKDNEHDSANLESSDPSSENEDQYFPNTSIKVELTAEKGATAAVERANSKSEEYDTVDVIQLGDGIPIEIKRQDSLSQSKGGAKLSAKQRREMKKKLKRGNDDNSPNTKCSDNTNETEDKVDEELTKQKDVTDGKIPERQEQQQPMKRGQKSKFKKMKQKYGDQDEEDREMRMKILGSLGNEEKKLKGKKAKDAKRQQQLQEKKEKLEQARLKHQQRLTSAKGGTQNVKIEAEDEHDSGEEGDNAQQENMKILDALTGQPMIEDTLLFAIPVCAPYSSLSNYKFKVKVTPGNNKKGKASKMVVNAFLADKSTTSREKDLFKSLKDVDLSKNLPGKVRITAPNVLKLQKAKKK